MSDVQKNLADAFAGESQANRKYLAFAQKADEEGYPHAARLFRAAAAAETIHAHNHLRAMGGIGTTAENLKGAIGGETYEFENMYPPMIESAKAEGNTQAERSFSVANAVEQTHARLFQAVLDSLEGKAPAPEYHVCSVCGHTTHDGPPDNCPVCGAPKDKFDKID